MTILRRAGWTVIGCYVSARLLIAASMGPTPIPDTSSYAEIDLLGRAGRPWVLPVLFSITTDWIFLVSQTVVSALAFVALACAVGSTVRSQLVRVALLAAILLLGLSPRVTMWDATLGTESLAMSLTSGLIASIVLIDRVGTSALLLLVVGWLFLRDAHALLAVVAAPPMVIFLWRNTRKVAALGLLVVALWGFTASQVDRSIEAYNVTSNVAFRISTNDQHLAWFVRQGMPVPEAASVVDPPSRLSAFLSDPEFQAWAEGAGAITYSRFLVSHPDFALQAVGRIFVDDVLVQESMSDRTFAPYSEPATPGFDWLWPNRGALYAAIAILASVAGLATVALRGRLDRRFGIPSVLLASTMPHAILVYHGAPIEIARHAVVLNLVLIVACYWTVALSVDAVIAAEKSGRTGQVTSAPIVR